MDPKGKTTGTRRQLSALAALVVLYTLLAAAAYLFIPLEQLVPSKAVAVPALAIPRWQLALANGGIGIILYGLLGLAGIWLARRLGLPGVFRPGAGWRCWLLHPLLVGTLLGLAIALADSLFTRLQEWSGFPQPTFPFSLLAATTAAIGEEILFRSFVLGMWGFLLHLALRRWVSRGVTLRIANSLAALAFAAAHLGSALLVLGASSPAEIPALILLEILLLNTAVGWAAGRQYIRQGLVTAVGLHFWVDVVLHIVWPLIRTGTC